MSARKSLHARCHTPLHQCGQSSVCKAMRVRVRAICVRLRVLFAAPGHVLSRLLKKKKNMTPKPCPERHPEHEMSRCKHVRLQVSKQWHLDRCAIVQLSSPCQPDAPHLALRQKHVASLGHMECSKTSVDVLEWYGLARDGKRHIDTHLLKATCCQVVAKTVKRFWAALSEKNLM